METENVNIKNWKSLIKPSKLDVKLSEDLIWVTGEMMADSGSPFYQSGVINIGLKDGIKNGSAAVDGLGLVGRISGVGQKVARVLFLTDISSAIPIKIKRSNQKGHFLCY